VRTVTRIAQRRVVAAWKSTAFTLFTMGGVLFAICALTASYGGYEQVVSFLEVGTASLLAMYFLQELIVVALLRGRPAMREEFPVFHEAVDELMKGKWIMRRPRLWIVKMPEDVPNAVAFGPGVFGWHSIAITESLYRLMSVEELKLIVGHEFAHIRCKDTGILTALSFVLNGSSTLGKYLRSSGNPFAMIAGYIIAGATKYLLPIGTAAIQQEREFAADALAAMYFGSPLPLISGLRKLEAEFKRLNKSKKRRKGSILSDLYISHPKMDVRIAALEALTHDHLENKEQ
jgi:Zn-dependent protease with chaperone function